MEVLDAIQTEDVAFLQKHFSKPGKVNEPLRNGQTPLIYAIKNESYHAVECLIKLGANINQYTASSRLNGQNETHEETPLQVAVDTKNANMVYLLMKHGCRPGANRVSLPTILHRAIKWNSVCLVQLIVKQVVDDDLYVVQSGIDLSQHLLTAVQDNNTKIANAILELGCSPNQPHNNMVPIVIAANNNNMRMCQLLINYGALVNKHGRSTLGQVNTPLGMAICAGMSQAIKRLIALGSAVNSTIDWSMTLGDKTAAPGSSMLQLAVLKRHKQIIEFLLDAGADIAQTDKNKDTVFHLISEDASQEGLAILTLLLAHNYDGGRRIVDLDVRNNAGCTPLVICAKYQNLEAMHYFLTYGANPLLCYSRSPNVLHEAVRWSDSMEMVDLLLKYGCDVNAVSQGLTPLHIALSRGEPKLCRMLIEAGADVDVVAQEISKTVPCLNLAVLSQKEEIVRLMIEQGVCLKARSSFGETPVMLAARQKGGVILEMLLNNGAPMNTRNSHQTSALSQALTHNYFDNVETLISHGADVNIPKKRFETPLFFAVLQDSQRIVQLLVHAGAAITEDILKEFPQDLSKMRNPILLQWVQYQAATVRSLECLLRIAIRKHLVMLTRGRSIINHVYRLPLPTALQRFLALEDEVLLPLETEEDLMAFTS